MNIMKLIQHIPRNISILIIIIQVVSCSNLRNESDYSESGIDYCQFVDPFIGTAENGHTYPGATYPFGLVQASPETGNIGWEYCSGYHYEDDSIIGFAHTHLSGTGWMDLGDILIQPFTGKADRDNYKSQFSHDEESASPGYYSVVLKDFDVKTELTATQRAAIHRYTFPENSEKHILLDLKHGIVPSEEDLESHEIESDLNFENDHVISGYTITKGWIKEQHVYFVIHLSEPVDSKTWLNGPEVNRNHQVVLNFDEKAPGVMELKIALSTVSVDGARKNLEQEVARDDFESVRKLTHEVWKDYLSRIAIEASEKDKEIFYTGLYHNLVVPNNIADVDGQFRGPDKKVHMAENKAYYSTLSLWDTYRATNVLYAMLYPEVSNDIVKSMITHAEIVDVLPIWSLWGLETYSMIGNHSIPVIADNFIKSVGDFDLERAFEALKRSSTINEPKSNWEIYMKYGYWPSDIVVEEAVSRTLECCFDDWCVAQMAKKMGKDDEYDYFIRRAGFYKNLFNNETGLMRGRNSDSSWVVPFDPLKISHAGTGGGDYTEGNAWQYTWHVQHDVNGLIELIGGDERFVEKLDSLFILESVVYGDGKTVDISGLIGQYVHGNEPCHHVAYLYNYAGQPWKTQEKINTILNTMYDNTPAGLCGNDDAGQMSAWYIFSSLGFYPVTPASDDLILGTPQYKRAILHLPGGKDLTISRSGESVENFYVKSITLNGKPSNQSYLKVKDIKDGGNLDFIMSNKPVKEFGLNMADRPVSRIE